MDYTVCSRDNLRDYTWDTSHASPSVAEYARDCFAPAFEGSLTTSRFAGLFRCPGSSRGVMLGVSASTQRKDAVGRPIRTMAFLRAETEEEAVRLAAFFAECLRTPDDQSLLDATSPVARAVESIYQTKDVEEFIRYCRSLPVPSGQSGCLQGRLAIPRTDMDARKELAESLFGVIAGDAPFLLLLADREPDSVFKSSGSLFDRGMVRIFSGAVTATTPLRSREEEGGPKKKWLGRGEGGLAVAGFVLFVLGLAWIGKVYPPPPPRPSDLEGRTETNGGVVEGQGEALVEAASNREMETNPSGATQEGDATIDTKAEDPEREIVEDRPSIGVPSSDETVAGESDAKDEVAPATTAPVEELPSEPGLAVPETETPLDVDEPPPIPDSDGAPATAEESLLSPDLSELTETVVQEETSVMSPPNGERPQTPLSKREISRGKRHKSSPVRKNRKQVRISLLPPAPSTEVPPTNSPPEFQQTPEHLSEGLSPESCRGVPERPIQNPD